MFILLILLLLLEHLSMIELLIDTLYYYPLVDYET